MSDIRTVLTEIGYHLSECGEYYRSSAIFRNGATKTSLSIHKTSGKWMDFGTGVTGCLEDLVKLTLNLNSLTEAEEWLKTKGPVVIKQPEKSVLKTSKTYSREILKELVSNHSYWLKRGISATIVERFQGGMAVKGQMAGRYVFPIFNGINQIVGFAGRDIYNNSDRPKWKLIGSKMEWIYPWLVTPFLIAQTGKIILVESVGDMLNLYQAGIENVLVLFGINLGPKRLANLIKLNPNEIIIALNNDLDSEDNHGQDAAETIATSLINHFDMNQIKISLPPKKDFGDMNVGEIQEWYENCSL